jgi:hypothetical protein
MIPAGGMAVRMLVAAGLLANSGGFSSVVPLPSSEFTAYVEGELVMVSVPSNWRELPGSNAVTFAPEGAYGNAGVKSVFTHGVGMGLARNDKGDLQATTDDFIASFVLFEPRPGRTFGHSGVTIGDRPGLRTVLSRVSEATGERERVEVSTTLLRDGTLFYLLAVAPQQQRSNYAAAFERVVRSIRIIDGDRPAAVSRSAQRASRPFSNVARCWLLPSAATISTGGKTKAAETAQEDR